MSFALDRQVCRLMHDLHAEQSNGAALQRAVEATVELIAPCEAAGVSLAGRPGHLRTSAGSSAVSRQGDEWQRQLRQGPCFDAVWKHQVVMVEDLREERRWSRWTPRALAELEVRSVLSVRLFTREQRVGALNLYSARPRAFGPEHVEQTSVLAAHVAIASAALERSSTLERALKSRGGIGQAVGITMVRHGLTSAAAFDYLTRTSSEQNRKVAVIAAELIAEHEEDPTGSPSPRPRPVSRLGDAD